MKPAYEDLTGQRYGRLTVESLDRCRHTQAVMWRCRCACGGTTKVAPASLKRGKTQSCGCLRVHATRRGGALAVI